MMRCFAFIECPTKIMDDRLNNKTFPPDSHGIVVEWSSSSTAMCNLLDDVVRVVTISGAEQTRRALQERHHICG
jgi:hypothetical protein